MANNRIQIKRTSVSGRAANTTTLTNPGELALNMTDGIMYSTNGSVVFEIGANNTNQRVSGTLTVNAVSANGGVGTSGQVLTSNGTSAYWATSATLNAQQTVYTYTLAANTTVISGVDDNTTTLDYVAGLENVFINGVRQISGVDYNTTNATAITLTANAIAGEVVQVVAWIGSIVTASTNVNAQFAWTNTHSFSNTVTLKAISANGSLGTAGHVLHSNGTSTYWAADDSGTGTVTSIATANGLSGGPITTTGTLGVTTGPTLTVNTTGIHVNATNLSIATSQLTGDVALGTNTSGNYVATITNANGISGSSSTEGGTPTIGVVTGSTLTVNTTGIHVNSTLSLTDLTLSGNLTVSGTRTYVNTTTLDVGDNIITLNADLGASAPSQDAGIEIMRGTSANVQFMWDETNDRWSTNGQPLAVSSLIPSANIILGSAALSSNGSLGTAGHVLHSNGTATYWAADDQGVTSVATANGLTGGTITSTGTLGVASGSTLTVNTTGIHVNSALAITSLTLAGALSGVTTAAMGNTTITGFANVSSTLQVGTNTATFGTAAYIVANGNVGIGTASPGAKLTVVDGYTDLAGLRIAGTAMDSYNNIYLASGDLSLSTGSGAITFKPSLTEGVRIDSSGKVGIGTTGPGYALDVAAGDTTAGLGYGMRLRSNATANAAAFQFTNSPVTAQNGLIACTDAGVLTIQGDSATAALAFRTNGEERFRINASGGITSSAAADAVGYKGLPQNSQASSYTLALSDIGKHISITTGGVVIPANASVAFPIGATIVIFNNSGGNQTISITSDTLRLAGTATTGSRTLAQYGLATLVKVTSTVWVATGNVT